MKQTAKMREQSEQAEVKQEAVAQAREFASAEEVLRADAAGMEVPERVKTRLAESIAQEPTKSGPWWRKLFGG
jgi:hypothetical protein